jgi:uncharacterized membrane protein
MDSAAYLDRLRHRLPARPRLLLAVLGGAVLYLVLPGAIPSATRLVLAWDLATIGFLAMIALMMAHATQQTIRYRAAREDESAVVILVIMVGAALASMAAIFFLLHEAKDAQGWLASARIALAGLTILLSWLLCHTIYALHYAHGFYGVPAAAKRSGAAGEGPVAGGLAFPGEEHPDYWDFLYFSFVVGMTCQVSDVQVTSRPMRRLTLAHGVVAFAFNTVILALTINLAAGLL